MKSEEFESKSKITADAVKWLVAGGLFAICLVLFLVKADDGLSTSTAELDKANTLRTVRTSQAGVAAPVEDPRQSERNY